VDELYALSGTIAEFHRLIPFRKMAILLDPELLRAVPELEANARELVRSAGADAVYLTPYPALSDGETARRGAQRATAPHAEPPIWSGHFPSLLAFPRRVITLRCV
jgi:hypothetical protein